MGSFSNHLCFLRLGYGPLYMGMKVSFLKICIFQCSAQKISLIIKISLRIEENKKVVMKLFWRIIRYDEKHPSRTWFTRTCFVSFLHVMIDFWQEYRLCHLNYVDKIESKQFNDIFDILTFSPCQTNEDWRLIHDFYHKIQVKIM